MARSVGPHGSSAQWSSLLTLVRLVCARTTNPAILTLAPTPDLHYYSHLPAAALPEPGHMPHGIAAIPLQSPRVSRGLPSSRLFFATTPESELPCPFSRHEYWMLYTVYVGVEGEVCGRRPEIPGQF